MLSTCSVAQSCRRHWVIIIHRWKALESYCWEMTQFVGSQGLISQIRLIEIDTGFIKLYWWGQPVYPNRRGGEGRQRMPTRGQAINIYWKQSRFHGRWNGDTFAWVSIGRSKWMTVVGTLSIGALTTMAIIYIHLLFHKIFLNWGPF